MSQATSGRQDTRRSHPEPLPADANGKRLCELFNYPWQFITATLDHPHYKPKWETITRYPLRPRNLWTQWQDPNQLIGVRFGHTTSYALIDIDAKSQYLNPTAIADLQYALETIGICRVLILRSSWSGGLHLYLPLPEAVNTFSLACTLKHSLTAQGFELAPGQLELFPNVKAWANHYRGEFTQYNGHRLPLQPDSGSTLLDAELNPQPHGTDLGVFFQQWDIVADGQDLTLLNSALNQGRNHQRKRNRRHNPHSHIIATWQADLEDEIAQGWTDYSQTNHLLKTIACYGVVFQQHSGDDLIDYIQHTATHSPGYYQWCRHRHEIRARAKAWAKAAESYYWPLGSNPKRNSERPKLDGTNNIVNFNQERATDAQNRIRAAVEQLRADNQLPDGITARANVIAQCAETSHQTLYKPQNLPLWHPHHADLEPASIETTEQCERPDTTSTSTDSANSSLQNIDRLKRRENKELHTLKQYMKGWAFAYAQSDQEQGWFSQLVLTFTVFCPLFLIFDSTSFT